MAEKKTFLLRISPQLWEELQRWAADELRSVNAQIEFLLRQAVAQRNRQKGGAISSPPHPPPKDSPE